MGKFEPGQLLATASIADDMERSAAFREGVTEALRRHLSGDWGDLDPEDTQTNEDALLDGSRLFSAYHVQGVKIWIITEAKDDQGRRSATTILRPEEY